MGLGASGFKEEEASRDRKTSETSNLPCGWVTQGQSLVRALSQAP